MLRVYVVVGYKNPLNGRTWDVLDGETLDVNVIFVMTDSKENAKLVYRQSYPGTPYGNVSAHVLDESVCIQNTPNQVSWHRGPMAGVYIKIEDLDGKNSGFYQALERLMKSYSIDKFDLDYWRNNDT